MPFAVKVRPEVARMKPGDAGTRQRAGLVFSRIPTTLEKLPDEVKADPMLIVEKIEAKTAKAKPAPKTKAKAKVSEG